LPIASATHKLASGKLTRQLDWQMLPTAGR